MWAIQGNDSVPLEAVHLFNGLTTGRKRKVPMVVDPLGLFDCCPTTDGAVAALLTTPEIAKDMQKDYILIKGNGLAVTYGYFSMAFQEDNAFLGFKSTREAAAMAYRQAEVNDPQSALKTLSYISSTKRKIIRPLRLYCRIRFFPLRSLRALR
jgi:acetyl-CoA C-acetyltransferase